MELLDLVEGTVLEAGDPIFVAHLVHAGGGEEAVALKLFLGVFFGFRFVGSLKDLFVGGSAVFAHVVGVLKVVAAIEERKHAFYIFGFILHKCDHSLYRFLPIISFNSSPIDA